jgi:hypothetical protein
MDVNSETEPSSRHGQIGYAVLACTWDHTYEWRFDEDAGDFGRTEALTFRGVVMGPSAYAHGPAEVVLFASERHRRPRSSTVGTVALEKGLLSAWAFVPFADVSRLAVVSASGKARLIRFTGSPASAGQGFISAVSASTWHAAEAVLDEMTAPRATP